VFSKIIALNTHVWAPRTPHFLEAQFCRNYKNSGTDLILVGNQGYRIDETINQVTEGGKIFRVSKSQNHPTGWGPAAIKFMSMAMESQLDTARREVIIMQLLGNHPAIVPLLDVGLDDEAHVYIVMDYAERGALRRQLLGLEKENKRLPKETVISYIRDIASGLSHCHQHNIVHRDLKPENILIFEERLKLCDFGSGQFIASKDAAAMIGTPEYIAPEIMQEAPNLDPKKSDIWALGLILLELVGAPCPILEDDSHAPGPTLLSITSGKYNEKIEAHLQTHLQDWWFELASVLLAKNPADRPSAAEFLEKLPELIGDIKTRNFGRKK
jgi:serine/threonine protein kinase